VQLIHARGYVSSFIAIVVKKVFGQRILFDPRALLADEYAEYGQWPRWGLSFKLVKYFEKRLFNSADGLIVLSQRHLEGVKREYHSFRDGDTPSDVIPCCVDTEIYFISSVNDWVG
jgi:glycosyltransferase involved in cell wall biosynthesis